MKRFSPLRIFAILTLLPALALAAEPTTQPVTPLTHDARLALLRRDLTPVLENFQRASNNPHFEPTTREFTYAAQYLLALNHPAAEAEALIQKAFDQQIMDPASPAYGTLPWQINHPEIKDANAVEFTAKPLGSIFLLYSNLLSPDFKKAAIPHLKAFAAGIRHHRVNIDYTNIFLMKQTNLYALGLILHDPALADEGIHGFHDWFAFTRTHGITEYDSPTYANTQISCLLETYRIATDPLFKKEIKAALDYMWTDLASNTFLNKNLAGGAQLSGPFSRTYDFTNGDGPFDRYLFTEGLRNANPATTILVDNADPLVNGLEPCALPGGGYHPPESILALPRLPERLIHQRVGIQEGQDRTCYLTPNFAIGSTSAYAGPQDRQLSISLAERTPNKTIPDISIILDPYDDPYGNHRAADRSGHLKPTHFKNASATIQDKATILSLLDLSLGLTKDAPQSSIATNLLFPANADELLLDGQPIILTSNQSIPISPNSWLIIREGTAAAALRIFTADDCTPNPDPNTPRFFIKSDGQNFHAARLVAYHLNLPESKAITFPDPPSPIRAGILLLAHDCPTPDAAHTWYNQLKSSTLTQSTENEMWSATFTNGPDSLNAVLNLPRHRPARRAINNQDFQPTPFTLNGEDKTTLLP